MNHTTLVTVRTRARQTWRAALLAVIMAAAMLAPSIQPAAADEEPATEAVRYVTPLGGGDQTGTSWSDAATLTDLDRLIAEVGPGGQVLLHAGLGDYETDGPISVSHGGAEGAPVVVRGVDAEGAPAHATIVGQRTEPFDPNGEQGTEVFRLLSGADHLEFARLAFRNQGNGCFRIAADIADLHIHNVTAHNVKRFIENTASGPGSATVAGMVVRDVVVRGYSRAAIRLRYQSHQVLIEDVHGDSERQDGDDFAVGVALSGRAHHITLRRVTMLNSHSAEQAYWNGDGFSAERGNHHLLFKNTLSTGHTDAGYDLKSTSTRLLQAVAKDNKRNFRIWGDVELHRCRGWSPHLRGGTGTQAQVHATYGATALLNDCRFYGNGAGTIIFDVDADAELTVKGGQVRSKPEVEFATLEPNATLTITDLDWFVAP